VHSHSDSRSFSNDDGDAENDALKKSLYSLPRPDSRVNYGNLLGSLRSYDGDAKENVD